VVSKLHKPVWSESSAKSSSFVAFVWINSSSTNCKMAKSVDNRTGRIDEIWGVLRDSESHCQPSLFCGTCDKLGREYQVSSSLGLPGLIE
jgi:hypothetical protein